MNACSLVIAATGELFSWGCGNFGGINDGQLGNGAQQADAIYPGQVVPDPPLDTASGEVFVAAACGCYHSVALTSLGQVLTFGLNNFGQLGRSGVPVGNLRLPREAGEPNYSDGTPRSVERGKAPPVADNFTATPSPTSQRNDTDDGVAGIGAGFYNTFLLLERGGVLCAGR